MERRLGAAILALRRCGGASGFFLEAEGRPQHVLQVELVASDVRRHVSTCPRGKPAGSTGLNQWLQVP